MIRTLGNCASLVIDISKQKDHRLSTKLFLKFLRIFLSNLQVFSCEIKFQLMHNHMSEVEVSYFPYTFRSTVL